MENINYYDSNTLKSLQNLINNKYSSFSALAKDINIFENNSKTNLKIKSCLTLKNYWKNKITGKSTNLTKIISEKIKYFYIIYVCTRNLDKHNRINLKKPKLFIKDCSCDFKLKFTKNKSYLSLILKNLI